MKPIVDASVILRYLLADNKEQLKQSRKIIQKGACTTIEIIAEVVYVLKGVYKVPKTEISDCLLEFLSIIEIEEDDLMKESLSLFKMHNLDFVDCILVARNNLCHQKVYTFDKKLNKLLS